MSAASGLTFGRVLKGEWVKFSTLRSTWITYGVALLIALGIGTLATWGHGQAVHSHPESEPWDPVLFTQTGIFLGQLAIGVLGVLFVTGEYATGMIRATMSAVPKRTPVVVAKVLVFGTCTVVVAAIMTFGAYVLGNLVVHQYGLDHAINRDAIRGLLGATYYLTIVGLIGVGLGFALRHTAGAIASLFALILVLPLIVSALPHSWSEHINKFLPLNIFTHLVETTGASGPGYLSRPVGVATLAAYALIAIGLGWMVLKRRDV